MKSMSGYVVTSVSLIPSYFIGLLSLLSVIILFTRPVKNLFSRIDLNIDKSKTA
jgi:hypothetical protein